ncbi:acetyl-CoA synthetase-like protein [Dendrothele bispora CBS 962.96]|uniref:Acetyl-CoA synthetase-like protein n=1 Tax=Dendrothele bispora (strain CBS 962.96) TaxID=1314807 RepID=A0A4S8MXK4_DENBC|nr:acetyl-CoA synthetase-like protein [Dendrothele bispora CBS 962.96]
MSPSAPLSHLSPVDKALFYHFGIGSKRPVATSVIHHAFQQHAEIQPDAVAVEHVSRSESITYSKLELLSNRLARRLRAKGIVPGARVCILAARSIPFVVGILAVLKSGGQYVPLDAGTITDETLQFVLQDASPALVLVMEEYAHRIGDGHDVVCLEAVIQEDELAEADGGRVVDLSSSSDGAYCIYTSGTTGQPKGVSVRHEGVTNVISGSPGNVGMCPGLRVAQLLNIAFDMGAWEVLGSLYNGCTLCLRGNTSKEWYALLKTVDIVISTPSILTRHNPEDYPNIKHVIVGGEPCPQALADRWAQYTNFNNCCGPTEISICNTVQRHTPGYPLSIGRPIPNTNVYILSPETESALPIGEAGCMWVGGIGTNTHYLNLPERTAERWRDDPFVVGGKMFNTGDLGRWRKDGQLDHMGRVDDQVKVKGFRVELDGVSAAMRTYTPVRTSVTLLVDSELWGFVTPSTVDLSNLRSAVAEIQPSYAVPNHYLAFDDFPMTKNGKVDKRALATLAQEQKGVLKRSREGQPVLSSPSPSPSLSSSPRESSPSPAPSLTSESDSLSTPSLSDFLATPGSDDSQFTWEQMSTTDEAEQKDSSTAVSALCSSPSATASVSKVQAERKLMDVSEDFQGDVLKKLRIAWA